MLEGLAKGLMLWLYGLLLSGVEYIASALLDVFKMDMTYFETAIPISKDIFTIIVAVGWALLIGNLAFQAMKTMASGIGFEGEDPKILFCRTFVFGFLLLASRQICEIGMAISSSVIDLLQVPNGVTFPKIEESAFDFDGSWVLVIIVGVVMIFQIIKLFFQMGERYAIVAVLTILSPLAFAMGGSKNTEDVFKGWARMFASMCVMMVMNVIFLKIMLSVMSTTPSGLAVLPWLVLAVAIGKVAKKIDDIVSRIGMSTARTGDPLGKGNLPGMLTMMVVRNLAGHIAPSSTSHSSSAKPQASGSGGKSTVNRNGNVNNSPSSPHFSSNNSSSTASQTGGIHHQNSSQAGGVINPVSNLNQDMSQSSTLAGNPTTAAAGMQSGKISGAPQTRPPSGIGSAKTNTNVRMQSVSRQESHSAGTPLAGTTPAGKDVPNRPPIGSQSQVPRQETKINESSHILQSGSAGTATAGNPSAGTSSAASGIPNRPPIGRPTASQVDKGAQSMSRQEISGNSKSGSSQGAAANLGRNRATTTATVKNTSIQSSQGVPASPGRKSANPQTPARPATQKPADKPIGASAELYSRRSGADVPPLQSPVASREQKPQIKTNTGANGDKATKSSSADARPKRPPIGTRDNNRGDRK